VEGNGIEARVYSLCEIHSTTALSSGAPSYGAGRGDKDRVTKERISKK